MRVTDCLFGTNHCLGVAAAQVNFLTLNSFAALSVGNAPANDGYLLNLALRETGVPCFIACDTKVTFCTLTDTSIRCQRHLAPPSRHDRLGRSFLASRCCSLEKRDHRLTDLNNIRIFECIARKLNLGDAAQELGVATSTMGRKLDALEAEFGARLVYRGTRHFELTDAGEAFAMHCRYALHQINLGRDTVRRYLRAPSGRVRVLAPSALTRELVGTRLATFYKQYPDIELSLSSGEHGSAVSPSEFDIAVRDLMPTENWAGIRLLGTSSVGFFAAPALLNQHATPHTLGDLAHLPVALTVGAHHVSHFHLLMLQATTAAPSATPGDVVVKPVLTTDDSQVLLSALLAGAAVGGLAHWQARPLVEAGLLVHVLPHINQDVPVYAVFPSATGLPERVRLVLDFLHASIGPAIAARCASASA